MSPYKHARSAVSSNDVCNVCGCVRVDMEGEGARRASKLGHNGIKTTDGIISPEFVERTQTHRKIQGGG